MLTRSLIAVGAVTAAAGLTAAPILAAAPHTRRVAVELQVRSQAKPQCRAKLCTIRNAGTGTMAGYGKVTFTTVITDDLAASPCPGGSSVPALRRTIDTAQGELALNEAGLVCPEPKPGPRVDLVWVVDGAQSTGAFAGARGSGVDHAYLARHTAVQTGTILLR